MKYAIPEISWHNRDPVLSVDFQPKSATGDSQRLATGGTDTHVVIWYISTTESGSVDLEVAADMTRHQKAVNVVRWSPSGELLASGDDESIIFIWKQKTEEPAPQTMEGEEQYKESWVVHKTLRGHMEDVLDLSWSASSLHLASGSVDNKLLLWDVARGRHTSILADHKGFVQGVAWDPKGQFVATASTDRVFRIFDVQTKKVTARSSKAILPFPSNHPLHDVKVRLYHDDTLQTYYRRLSFSPDGLFIAVPGGRIEPEQGKLDVKAINAVYIYTRHSLKVPACVIPCGDVALVCRWSPVTYTPRRAGPPAGLRTGRRLLLAVGTKRSVLLYDTQQKTPIAMISNIHYTRLTDLSWSPDGRLLVASSTDGFCSVIMFSSNELGEPAPIPTDTQTPTQDTEPMEIAEDAQPDQKEKQEKPDDPKPSTPKINKFMKFKAPEKSPKKKKNEPQQKTPVKVDLLVETAMPSWSDNSNSEVVKPIKEDPPIEIMEIEDSEDIKLVYEDTLEGKSQDEQNKSTDEKKELQEQNKSTEEKKKSHFDEKKSHNDEKKSQDDEKKSQDDEKKSRDDEKKSRDDKKKSPEKPGSPKQGVTPSSKETNFFKQAKVTDVKQPAVKAIPSPKAPRRVSFVTLSSPKRDKKC